MALQRVSPGRYKDPKTGKIYNLATAKEVEAMNKKLSKPAAQKPAAQVPPPMPGPPPVNNPTQPTVPTTPALPTGPQQAVTNVTKPQTELGAAVGKEDKALGEDVSIGNKIATEQAGASNLTQNANISGPLGSQTTTIDPLTGQPITTHTLSENQGAILAGGEGITKAAQGKQGDWLGSQNKFQFDQSPEGRQKMADAVFNQLSRGMDVRHKATSDQLSQDLYNRGIQFSEDPNSRYQQEMRSMKQGQEDERMSYANQAYQAGLGEQQAQFGMAQGTQQQQMNDINMMNSQGLGFMMPNYQATQGAETNIMGGTQVAQTGQQLNTQSKAAETDRMTANAAIAKMKRNPGGSGSSQPSGNQAFVAG